MRGAIANVEGNIRSVGRIYSRLTSIDKLINSHVEDKGCSEMIFVQSTPYKVQSTGKAMPEWPGGGVWLS